jgi:triosephosphate isomerase
VLFNWSIPYSALHDLGFKCTCMNKSEKRQDFKTRMRLQRSKTFYDSVIITLLVIAVEMAFSGAFKC